MDWISKGRYHYWAGGSFVVLAVFGVVLRLMHIAFVPHLNYIFLLHAHSHFAFAGWAFLGLAMLLAGRVSPVQRRRKFLYALNATLVSAYGMLVSFSFQGYKTVSIIFSTFFILSTYYFTRQFLKSLKETRQLSKGARQLTLGALFFLCFSSLGPLALGPLMVMGLKGTAVYQDAIYVYLHFQLNGWMQLAAIALVEITYFNMCPTNPRRWVYQLLIWSNLPLYLIFTLWSNPAGWVFLIAGIAATGNLTAWFMICRGRKARLLKLPLLLKVAFLAITLKTVFQTLVCIPVIGRWAFSDRNIIIGYIHLLTLGIVTPVILDQFKQAGFFGAGKKLQIINGSYIVLTFAYLVILFVEPALKLVGIIVQDVEPQLLLLSILLLLCGVGYFGLLILGSSKKSEAVSV